MHDIGLFKISVLGMTVISCLCVLGMTVISCLCAFNEQFDPVSALFP